MRLFSLPLFFFSLSAYPYSLRCSPPPTIGGLPPAWRSAVSPIGHRCRSPGRNLFLRPPFSPRTPLLQRPDAATVGYHYCQLRCRRRRVSRRPSTDPDASITVTSSLFVMKVG
uniref:Secreted protein n=1 Tax=Opuntia streptacantha TaxID=393608 RepID=A0A7C9DG75_OPUST